jgi:hypothetical protein
METKDILYFAAGAGLVFLFTRKASQAADEAKEAAKEAVDASVDAKVAADESKEAAVVAVTGDASATPAVGSDQRGMGRRVHAWGSEDANALVLGAYKASSKGQMLKQRTINLLASALLKGGLTNRKSLVGQDSLGRVFIDKAGVHRGKPLPKKAPKAMIDAFHDVVIGSASVLGRQPHNKKVYSSLSHPQYYRHFNKRAKRFKLPESLYQRHLDSAVSEYHTRDKGYAKYDLPSMSGGGISHMNGPYNLAD